MTKPGTADEVSFSHGIDYFDIEIPHVKDAPRDMAWHFRNDLVSLQSNAPLSLVMFEDTAWKT